MTDEEELELFHKTRNDPKVWIETFTSMDNIIKAAYTNVSETGQPAIYIGSQKYRLFAFKTHDGQYMTITVAKARLGKHELYDKIIRAEIPIIDFINKQMDLFL